MGNNAQEEGVDLKKALSGETTQVSLISDKVVKITTVRSSIQRITNGLKSSATIRCDNMTVHYHPYMRELPGSIMIQVYDNRYRDPQKSLLIHTSFPAAHDQYIEINPSIVVGEADVKEPIELEIVPVGVNISDKVNYGRMTFYSKLLRSSKQLKGGIPTLRAYPGLLYTRGDLLDSQVVTSITRCHEFNLVSLEEGNSYVIRGNDTSCKLFVAESTKEEYDKQLIKNSKASGSRYSTHQL
ncbi:P4 protein [Yerba mate virus A]|uniref:P4 protein n=1 Tax=Yerba mate virus A TaxID=2713499 RepID=A0A6G6CIG8_9RHAB|nr:P4 protein [Yerba mate virus A]QID92308.1 P4 protein [Yerba mate virus A]